MKYHQHAIATAIFVLLSVFITYQASANTDKKVSPSSAEQATESNQPAQTQEAVIAASEEGVKDALRDVEASASQFVNEQKRLFREQGRENGNFYILRQRVDIAAEHFARLG